MVIVPHPTSTKIRSCFGPVDGDCLQFAAFLYTGRKTPTTDEVCDALTRIRTDYPHLEATEVGDLIQKHPC